MVRWGTGRNKRPLGAWLFALALSCCLCPTGLAQTPTKPAASPPAPTKPVAAAVALPEEVEVPFDREFPAIIIPIKCGDKTVNWWLDTGIGFPMWPKHLELDCRRTGIKGPVLDVTGKNIYGEGAILTELGVGEEGQFRLSHIPSLMVDTSDSTSAQTGDWDPTLHNLPLLGNNAFVGTSLTLDFDRGIMTVRRGKSADSRTSVKAAHILRLPMSFDDNKHSVVRCKIAGVPVRMIVDTGAIHEAIAVNPATWNRVVASMKGKVSVSHDQVRGEADLMTPVSVEKLFPVPVMLSDTSDFLVQMPLIKVTNASVLDGVDGVLNLALLKHFRVTFDYPSKLLILEPRKSATVAAAKPVYRMTLGLGHNQTESNKNRRIAKIEVATDSDWGLVTYDDGGKVIIPFAGKGNSPAKVRPLNRQVIAYQIAPDGKYALITFNDGSNVIALVSR